jgi:hypothetical protein
MNTVTITLGLNGIWKRVLRTQTGTVTRYLFAIELYISRGRLCVSALFRETTRNGKLRSNGGGTTAMSLAHFMVMYTRLNRAPRGMGRCKKTAEFAPNMT